VSVMSADQAALGVPVAEPVRPPVGRRSTLPAVVAGGLAAAVVGLAVGLGGALWVAVAVVVLAAVVVSTRTQLGFLHLLVLAPFGESLAAGPVTIGRLLAALSGAVLLFLLVTGRLDIPRFRPAAWLPATGFVLFVFASGFWASDSSAWQFAVGQVGLAVLFFAAFALLVRTPAHVAGLLRVYVLGAVFASVVGLLQAASTARAVGLQGDANIYALYQTAALPAAIALAAQSTGLRRWCWLAATVPITVSILASQSRGAYIAFVVTLLVMAALHERRRLYVPIALTVGVVGGVAATFVDARYSLQRVAADRASGRLDIWHVAWQAFLDQPWTGLGAGNFVPQSIERLTTVPGVELLKSHLLLGSGIEVHNIYLESLAERGVFGLVTLAAFLLTTLWLLFLAARRHHSAVVTALVPMLVAYCVAAFFLSVSNSKLLWMLAGLAAALLAVRRQENQPDPSPDPAPRSLP
jgi:O-antigen ligase